MESHHSQRSMQSLLHSPSPGEDDQDILQSQQSLNGTYIPIHNSGDMTFNTWSPFNPHPHTSSLQERVQTLGELRLPPDTNMHSSTPLERFMTDESSSKPLVQLNSSSRLASGYHLNAHNSHLSIATSWDGHHEPSYHDSADASSAVSSVYDCPYSADESSWTGSPDDQHFRDVNYDTSASPTYHRGHSQRSSMDLSPASQGHHHWRGHPAYLVGVDSNIDINSAAVAPLTVTNDHHLGRNSSYVNLKNIQLSPTDEEKDGDDSVQGGLTSNRPERNGIPDIYLNGQEHSDHEHDHEQHIPWEMSQEQYYNSRPMEVECSSPSPTASPQASPRSAAMLEAKRRRRSRSGSGASKLSAKAHAELMKPYKDPATNINGKSHKGRGAGKKVREKPYCPEHPTKAFRHNSDYRKHMQTKHTRPFLCTFSFANCDQTFGSKNEWKRHVFSQHLQLHYWRCDYADCAERKAFFNRKDLFGQHMKRMHGPKHGVPKNSPEMKKWLSHDIPEIQERCRKERRTPPEWSKCGYCMKEFSGTGSWDARMEHVGKHYEKNNYKEIDTRAWIMDEGLIAWAIQTKIIEKGENGEYKLLCHGKDSIEGEERRRSQFEQINSMSNDDDYEQDAEGEDE